jgi:hypothetical protein
MCGNENSPAVEALFRGTCMRKWFLALIAVNIVIFGAVIWHRRSHPPVDSYAAMAQKLLRDGTVVRKKYHLKHQKATVENVLKHLYIFEEARTEAKYPNYFGVAPSGLPSELNYCASPVDIPLLEKAIEKFDSMAMTNLPAIKKTEGAR